MSGKIVWDYLTVTYPDPDSYRDATLVDPLFAVSAMSLS
jgi:hypothetical protein